MTLCDSQNRRTGPSSQIHSAKGVLSPTGSPRRQTKSRSLWCPENGPPVTTPSAPVVRVRLVSTLPRPPPSNEGAKDRVTPCGTPPLPKTPLRQRLWGHTDGTRDRGPTTPVPVDDVGPRGVGRLKAPGPDPRPPHVPWMCKFGGAD